MLLAQAIQAAEVVQSVSVGDILSLIEGLTVRGLLGLCIWAFLTEKVVPIGRLRESQAETKSWKDISLATVPTLKRVVEKE